MRSRIVCGWLVFALVACGGRSADPRAEVPVVLSMPGASAEEVDAMVVAPLAERLAGLSGVRSIRTEAREDGGLIVLEVARASHEDAVRAQVSDRIRDARAVLPDDVVPVIGRLRRSGSRSMVVVIRSGLPITELGAILDGLVRPRLEAIPGVVDVDACGRGRSELQVELDPMRLARFGVTAREVRATLAGNFEAPAGRIDDRGAETIASRTIAVRADGIQIGIGDVATVRRGLAPADCLAADPEGAVVTARVSFAPDAQGRVRDAMRELEASLPPGVALDRFEGAPIGRVPLPIDAEEERARILEKIAAEIGARPGARVSITARASEDAEIFATGVDARRLLEAVVAGSGVTPIPAEDPILVEIVGDDRDALSRSAAELELRLGGERAVAAVERDGVRHRRVVTPDRARMADLGVSTAEVADTMRLALGGEVVASLVEGDRRLDVRLRFALASDHDALASLDVRASDGRSFPLAHLARIEERSSPVVLRRRDGRPVVQVRVIPAPGERDGARASARRIAAELGLRIELRSAD